MQKIVEPNWKKIGDWKDVRAKQVKIEGLILCQR